MLRHIVGFVLGVVLTPALPYVIDWGTLRAFDSVAKSSGPTSQTMLTVGILVIVGAAVGALTSARWLSPLAALVPGIVFLTVTAVSFFVSPDTLIGLVPRDVSTWTGLVYSGILALLGALLVVSALPPQRWRGKAKGVAPDPSYLQPPAMPQPAGQPAWESSYAPPGGFGGPPAPPRT